MVKVQIDPGICGLKTTLTVTTQDMQNASVHIESQCPGINDMQAELENIDCFEECFAKFDTSKVYECAGRHIKHLSCPVPSAIIKGLEAACGFALPKNVDVQISKS